MKMIKTVVKKINTLTGHNDSIYTLERSAEKNIFYSAGGDGMVAMWDLDSPDTGRLIAHSPASVYAIHYFEKDNALIIGQNFFGIHAIDPHTKTKARALNLTSAAIFDIKSYHDQIIVSTGDGSIFVVNYEDLQIVKHVKASNKSARTIAVNTAIDEIAVGFSDNAIRIYDGGLRLKKEIREHTNSVFSLNYSPDFQYLLSAGRDARLKAWDVQANYELSESIVAHIYAINHIAYRPDGKYFVTGSLDKSIKVWDAGSLRLLKVIDKARHAGHGSSVNKLFWSDYHDQLIACSDDRTISIWDLKFIEER